MKRASVIALALVAAILVPVASGVAGSGKGALKAKKLAAKQCRAEKKADKRAFKAAYGKRAMRTCKRVTKPEAKEAKRSAQRECRAEREELGREAFREKYGTNEPKGNKSKGGKRNAFGKCVSGKVRAERDQDAEQLRNAARECRAEREELGRNAFRDAYGTNEPKGAKSKGGKRNAFGKCVSSKVKEAEVEE